MKQILIKVKVMVLCGFWAFPAGADDPDIANWTTLNFPVSSEYVAALLGSHCGALGFKSKARYLGMMSVYKGNLICMVNFLKDDEVAGVRVAFGLPEKSSVTKHIAYRLTPSAEDTEVSIQVRLAVLDTSAEDYKDFRSYDLLLPNSSDVEDIEGYVRKRIMQ